jgi:2-dehydro-3-deoxy-D-gluconate 5-dehydrogenase
VGGALAILDRFRLDGRVAAVSGTSRGIGRALALALAGAGADIVHIDRSDPAETRARVSELGRRSHLVRLDLDGASVDDYDDAIEQGAAALGRIDILVNNAGIIGRGPTLQADAALIEQVIRIDLLAPLHLARAAGRRMVAQRSGKIINVASLMSFQGGRDVAAYTTAKHGVAGLTKALANEWASFGVQVNAIAPGYIATDANVDLRADETRAQEFETRIPAGRFGAPDDLSGAIVFLASAASDYVTGTVLVVDGGWLSR